MRAADEPWKRSNAYVMSFSGDWKDLSAKFVLQVWRDYCFTRSRPFLTDLYSLCKVCTVHFAAARARLERLEHATHDLHAPRQLMTHDLQATQLDKLLANSP